MAETRNRFDSCVLNRIAQLLTGDGAAEINYKGMKPDDIDRLVRAALADAAALAAPRIFAKAKGEFMKKNIGVKNWMFPMPVLMIGTYGEDGMPDVMNAAWGGITLEDEITICIDTSHKTWANIAAKKAFTVAFGTADTVKECDYLGIASGNKTPGKVAKSGFTTTKSEFVDAPVVNELPLVLECKLVSMNAENCNVVGKIVNCAVDEAAMTDGKPDAGKMKPICFDTCAHVYRLMGEVVAPAFSCGKELM